jgi:hypothetical protein
MAHTSVFLVALVMVWAGSLMLRVKVLLVMIFLMMIFLMKKENHLVEVVVGFLGKRFSV